jgi:two-component system, sensor histidine kinase RpfC
MKMSEQKETSLSQLFKKLKLSNRSTELEQSLVRILIATGLIIYLVYKNQVTDESQLNLSNHFQWIATVFMLAAITISLCIIKWPENSIFRHVVAIFLDMGALTYILIEAEEHASPFYAIYLWLIIGYGFRFGKKYLFIALCLALIGFGFVIYSIPFWKNNIYLSLGLWLGMLMNSLYLNTLLGRLYKALDQAEIANRAKRHFISSISHELRTPLNAIIGMVDLMESSPLNKEQKEMLDCMSTTSQVMLSQIEDVLDFAKIEAGKMTIEKSEFDLYQLVFSIIDIFRYQINPNKVSLNPVIACDVPQFLIGDERHIRQIMVNLIGNAVKFTERGQITIRIKKIEQGKNLTLLRFFIIDTGIGIAYHAQPSIFDSFKQADESTARRYGGTGLGTAICQQLVKLMHGKIGFSSEPGLGSEFWFDLPFETPSDRSKENSQLIQAEKIHIFFMSNQEKNIENIKHYFSKYQAEIIATSFSGLSAAAIVKKIKDYGEINLLMIDFPMSIAGYCDNDDKELVKNIMHSLSIAEKTASITSALIIPDGLSSKLADELIIALGLTAVLSAPINEIVIENYVQLHLAANAINENKSIVQELHDNKNEASHDRLIQTQHEIAKAHILIAEDNPVNRKVLQKILDRAGYHYSIAKDGDEALDLIDKTKFDAIVLDMNMPGMSGLEIARIYNIISGKDERAPMIMFSANVTPDAKESSLKAGVDEFLPKPIKIDTFLNVLNKLLSKKRSEKNSALNLKFNDEKIIQKSYDVLELTTLMGLEEVSADPLFLDELIQEFITENKKTVLKFEEVMQAEHSEEIKDVLHYLKGAAVSVGAMELLQYCKKIEKMNALEINQLKENIVAAMKNYAHNLCNALENYRFQRRRKTMALVSTESFAPTFSRTSLQTSTNQNRNI